MADESPSPSAVGGAEGRPEKDVNRTVGVSPVPDTTPEDKISGEAVSWFRAGRGRHINVETCEEPERQIGTGDCCLRAGLAAARPYLVGPDEDRAERAAELERLRDDNAFLNALFEVQWTRMGEATDRWRAEDPGARALIMPDLGALLAWLMADADRARSRSWFIGRCGAESEPDGAVCPADLYAAAGDVQVKCPTCGAWTGVAAPGRPRPPVCSPVPEHPGRVSV